MSFKNDFPIFTQRPDLIYLDSAATTQKPMTVLKAMEYYYTHQNSNIHRGPNFLAEEATIAYEDARRTVADFIGAAKPHEVIFTRNATEAINLVARTLGDTLQKDDEILISKLEHHSNIVPWLQLKERRGITIKYITLEADGRLKFDPSLFTKKTKVLALTGMSNALGIKPDIKRFIEAAKKVGALILLDASQLVVHERVNAQALDVDFLVFSGHKLYGPTGIGVLYGKESLLKSMPPFLGGGDMIQSVSMDGFVPADLPQKFEAGTPHIAGAIGLKAAIDYLIKIGYETLYKHEMDLTAYALERLADLPFVRPLGPTNTQERGPVVSFLVDGIHPHDVAEGLSQKNICIRAGHHCTQILMNELSPPGTARMSFGIYNEKADIDKAIDALKETYTYFN